MYSDDRGLLTSLKKSCSQLILQLLSSPIPLHGQFDTACWRWNLVREVKRKRPDRHSWLLFLSWRYVMSDMTLVMTATS